MAELSNAPTRRRPVNPGKAGQPPQRQPACLFVCWGFRVRRRRNNFAPTGWPGRYRQWHGAVQYPVSIVQLLAWPSVRRLLNPYCQPVAPVSSASLLIEHTDTQRRPSMHVVDWPRLARGHRRVTRYPGAAAGQVCSVQPTSPPRRRQVGHAPSHSRAAPSPYSLPGRHTLRL